MLFFKIMNVIRNKLGRYCDGEQFAKQAKYTR